MCMYMHYYFWTIVLSRFTESLVKRCIWVTQESHECQPINSAIEMTLHRYLNIVKACALEEDILGMHGGNMAEIVEQGGNLSGGQKARVALAR